MGGNEAGAALGLWMERSARAEGGEQEGGSGGGLMAEGGGGRQTARAAPGSKPVTGRLGDTPSSCVVG